MKCKNENIMHFWLSHRGAYLICGFAIPIVILGQNRMVLDFVRPSQNSFFNKEPANLFNRAPPFTFSPPREFSFLLRAPPFTFPPPREFSFLLQSQSSVIHFWKFHASHSNQFVRSRFSPLNSIQLNSILKERVLFRFFGRGREGDTATV